MYRINFYMFLFSWISFKTYLYSTILFVVTMKNAICSQLVVELWCSLYSSWAITAPPLVDLDMHDMIVPPITNQRDSMYSILPK